MLTTQGAPAYQIAEVRFWPRILVLTDFLSPVECRHLITLGAERIAPSTTVDPQTGELIEVASRTSRSACLSLNEDETVAAIEARIAALVNLPVENGEGIQILNYQSGQGYKPHFDFFDPALKGSEGVLACGGQRVATCIMYLNDVEAGGETHFPEGGWSAMPRQGDAILFYNILPDGAPDRMSLHASLPLLAGEKWAATKWVRERAYRTAS